MNGEPSCRQLKDEIKFLKRKLRDANQIIKRMQNVTDREKFKALFDSVGIEYTEDGPYIVIDQFHADGVDDCCLKFYDDGDSFKDFCFYGRAQAERSAG